MKFYNVKDVLNELMRVFGLIEFDPVYHVYTVNGIPIPMSVTQFIKKYIPETNFEAIASTLDKKYGLQEGTHKKLWELRGKEASTKGDRVHYYAMIKALNPTFAPKDNLEMQVHKFFESLPEYIEVVASEFVVYDTEDYQVAGTIDLLLLNKKTGKLIIVDWKTNGDLFKAYGKMKSTTKTFLNNNFNKYRLQLDMYASILEAAGFEVEDKIIVWINNEEEPVLLTAKIDDDDKSDIGREIDNYLFSWEGQRRQLLDQDKSVRVAQNLESKLNSDDSK